MTRYIPRSRRVLASLPDFISYPTIFCCAALLLGAAACSLELPEAPYFETEFTIPLGEERTTGWDLARDRAYLTGDSLGTGPLSFFYEGMFDTLRLDEHFDVAMDATRFFASLDRIALDPPAPVEERFALGELTDLPIPPEGDSLAIPMFTLPAVQHELRPQTAFHSLRIAGGRVRIGISNSLPVPIGTPDLPGPPLGVRLRDRSTGRVLFAATLGTSLLPGEDASIEASLDGVELTQLMDLELFGESAGSDGRRVWVAPSASLTVAIDFEDVVAESAIAVVGPQTIMLNESLDVDLGGDLGIVHGSILDGELPISIENELPLSATGTLLILELQEEGRPVPLEITIDAATNGVPGRFSGVIPLRGRSVRSLDGKPLRRLTFSLSVTTAASRGVIALTRDQLLRGSIGPTVVRFDDVEARPSALPLIVPNTITSIEVPGELEGLDLTAAELSLEVENALPFPATAELWVTGRSGVDSDDVSVPMRLSIAPGGIDLPVTSRVTIDEQGTRLLDLLELRPRDLSVSGLVQVGNEGRTAMLSRESWIRGRYEVTAPLRFRVDEILPEVDPFEFRVAAGVQDHIREDLVSAVAEGKVVNHFPLAAEVRIVFASSESGLADPEVTLDPVSVDAGSVDAQTGRVITARESAFSFPLTPEQVQFFARNRVWGRVEVRLVGDGTTVVIITATDYVEATGILRFRFGIGDDEADG